MFYEKRGFTLIELLVASAIFSALIFSIYSSFSAGILSYNRADFSLARHRAIQNVFNRMEADFKGIFTYLKDDSKFEAGKEGLRFWTRINLLSRDGQSVKDICHITYNFKDGMLKRACLKGLDGLSAASDDEGEVLSGDIKNISFVYAYADSMAPEKAYEWKDSIPEDKKNQLPLAVRITLIFEDKSRVGEKSETDKTIEYQKVINING